MRLISLFMGTISLRKSSNRLLCTSTTSSCSGSDRLPSPLNLQLYSVSVFDPELGQSLGCIVKNEKLLKDEQGLILQKNEVDQALQLCWGQKSTVKELPFRIDFTSPSAQLRKRQSKSELVCKAFGNTRQVIDLTAGLGRDSFMLAAAGFNVFLVERNPVLFFLLQDAVKRLRISDPNLGHRLQLVRGDSTDIVDWNDLLQRIGVFDDTQSPSIREVDPTTLGVYLDPMYESNEVGRKANVKKETVMLHRLVAPQHQTTETSSYQRSVDQNYVDNNKGLFTSALRLFGSRIVVKRPLKAAALLDMPPQTQVKGSTHRFDIYLSSNWKNRTIPL